MFLLCTTLLVAGVASDCATSNGGCDVNAQCAVDVTSGAVTCTCNANFAGDGQTCDPVVDGGDGTPCPSDCWQWNLTKKQCELKANNACFTVTCTATDMTVAFDSKLFDVQDSDVTPFGVDGPQFSTSTSKWEKQCGLGSCNQQISVNPDNGNLKFAYEITRDMQKIDVGDGADQTEVYVAPGGSGITFICEYPSTVDVESGEITVKGATASGSASQTGDLTTGFSLGLFIDSGFVTAVDATNLFIGQEAFVRLTWSVSTATAKIDFLVDECRVKDTADDSEVFIIKNNCYSNGLGTSAISASKRNDNTFDFKFVSFTMGDSSTIQMTAKVTCTVKMCLKSDASACPVNTLDSQCPTASGYDYKA